MVIKTVFSHKKIMKTKEPALARGKFWDSDGETSNHDAVLSIEPINHPRISAYTHSKHIHTGVCLRLLMLSVYAGAQ